MAKNGKMAKKSGQMAKFFFKSGQAETLILQGF